MSIEIQQLGTGETRTIDFVRFEGHDAPVAIVRWGLAGLYRVDLRTGHVIGQKGIPVVNWVARNFLAIAEEHARWLARRREFSRPALTLKGGGR